MWTHGGELPGVHAGGADVARLARLHHVVERLERLLDRRLGVEAMDLVEVDVVDAEAPQRAVDRVEDVLARQAAAVRVVGAPGRTPWWRARPRRARAMSLQRPAHHLLAHAARVHVGGVEEVDAVLERALDEGAARRLVQHPRPPGRRAVGHGAEAEPRDLQAGGCRVGRSPWSALQFRTGAPCPHVIRNRQRRQRRGHGEGPAEPIVLADPAERDRAGADAGVEGADQRAERGAAALVVHLLHQVGDEDRVGRAEAGAEHERRHQESRPGRGHRQQRHAGDHGHQARDDHLLVADLVRVAGDERPREDDGDGEDREVDAPAARRPAAPRAWPRSW